MEYMNQLIDDDVQNNSAWNQRWLSTHRGKTRNTPLSLDLAWTEADYAIEITTIDPYDDSPLRYLVALVKEQNNNNSSNSDDNNNNNNEASMSEGNDGDKNFVSLLRHVKNEIESLHNSWKGFHESAPLMGAYIDLLEMKVNHDDLSSLQKAITMANDLGMTFDIVWKKYWLMREERLRQKVLNLGE